MRLYKMELEICNCSQCPFVLKQELEKAVLFGGPDSVFVCTQLWLDEDKPIILAGEKLRHPPIEDVFNGVPEWCPHLVSVRDVADESFEEE